MTTLQQFKELKRIKQKKSVNSNCDGSLERTQIQEMVSYSKAILQP
jgi:hypothetical protein